MEGKKAACSNVGEPWMRAAAMDASSALPMVLVRPCPLGSTRFILPSRTDAL